MAGAERAFQDQLADPARRGEPLVCPFQPRPAALEGELAAAMAKFSAIGAAGIIMDIHSGEVWP